MNDAPQTTPRGDSEHFFHLGQDLGVPKPLDLAQYGGDTPEAFDPLPALAAEGVPLPLPIEVDTSATDGMFDGPYPQSVPTPVHTGNPKDLIGDTKPDLSLVPQAFNLLVSQAMMDGARKYGPYNWRDNPVRARVYIAAAMRHLGQFLDGEDVDPTSGVYHVGHAGACLAILADAMTVGNLIDDRPKSGAAGELIRRFGRNGHFGQE